MFGIVFEIRNSIGTISKHTLIHNFFIYQQPSSDQLILVFNLCTFHSPQQWLPCSKPTLFLLFVLRYQSSAHICIFILHLNFSIYFIHLFVDRREFSIQYFTSIQSAEGLPFKSRRQLHVEPGAREQAVSDYLISICC